MIICEVNKNHLNVRTKELLTAGSQNVNTVEFRFNAVWDGLAKTATFKTSKKTISVLLSTNTTVIPWEALADAGEILAVGVFGVSGETLVLPTVWGILGKVMDAAHLGDEEKEPTPDVYQKILDELNALERPTWDSLQNKPFSTLGSGLSVDENGVLSAEGGGGGSANAVQYVAQTLTDEQKAQARANVDADKKRIVVEARRSSGGSTMVYYNVDDQNAAIDKFIAEYKAGTEILLRLYNRDYPLTNIDEDGIVYFSGYIYDAANNSVGVIVYKMEKNKAVVEESSLYGIKAISLDSQLKYKGYAADAKAVGDALENFVTADELQNNYVTADELGNVLSPFGQMLNQKLDKNQGTGNAGKILGIGADGIVVPQNKPTYTLPQATADALGGIKADAATAEDTQVVRIGTDGKLRTKPSGSTVTVDDALSSTSENPVQNKVVTAALAGKIAAPTTAAVGQIIKVKSVDSAGKPTEWEAVTAKLANPNALTFTGAVTGSYDGSEPVTVEIPAGGGGSDTWETIIDFELTEDVASVTFTTDISGNPFSLKEFTIFVVQTPIVGQTTNNRIAFAPNKNGWGNAGNVELKKSPKETDETVYSFIHANTVDGRLNLLTSVVSANYTSIRNHLVESPERTNYNGSFAIKVNTTTNELNYCEMPLTKINFIGITPIILGAGSKIVVRGIRT